MGVTVRKNTLKSFVNKLGDNTENVKSIAANLIGQVGKEIAEMEYDITPEHQTVSVDYTIGENGNVKLFATGEGLIYKEYGTGIRGEGTYQGNLDFPIDFISPYKKNGENVPVHLDRWTYYYAYQLKLSDKQFKGHEAYAQMFNTSQRLRERFAKYIRE